MVEAIRSRAAAPDGGFPSLLEHEEFHPLVTGKKERKNGMSGRRTRSKGTSPKSAGRCGVSAQSGEFAYESSRTTINSSRESLSP